MRFVRVLLVVIAVVSFGVALSYPVRYRMAQQSNNSNMERLADLRAGSRSEAAAGAPAPEATESVSGQAPRNTVEPEVAPAGETPAESESGDPRGPAERETPQEGGEAEDATEVGPGMPKRRLSSAEARAPETESTDLGGAPDLTDASAPTPDLTPAPTPTPGIQDLILEAPETPTPGPTPLSLDGLEPVVTPVPTPTPDRHAYTGALPYTMKDRVTLDEDKILPELREIYELNGDLVGWLKIEDTVIDYPVVQTEDSEFYLTHDFYGEENVNGQIILDSLCDPYTPSYNLVISGHHMKNGSMFGDLPRYASRDYWDSHKLVEFDTLMERKRFVVFALFFSADYDEDEEGFRYNANICYAKEAERWLEEIRENQLFDTGIDVKFGDEFITLTTCDRERRRNGRFVAVCRRLREGEVFK